MNIRIFSYIQVPCDRPPHQIKKYLHIVKLQVFWEKRAWSSFLLKLMTFPGHLIVSACQFLHQRTSLLFSIFVSYTIPKTTESKNRFPLSFIHLCNFLRYDINYKKENLFQDWCKRKTFRSLELNGAALWSYLLSTHLSLGSWEKINWIYSLTIPLDPSYIFNMAFLSTLNTIVYLGNSVFFNVTPISDFSGAQLLLFGFPPSSLPSP